MAAFEWHGDEITRKLKAAAFKAIVRGTESVKTQMITHLDDGNKTGRIYKRNTVEHQASAPGETPATDIGRLKQSITTEVFPEDLAGRVNVNAKYAASLEFGTPNMEARPFARRSLAERNPDIQKDIQKEMAAVLR